MPALSHSEFRVALPLTGVLCRRERKPGNAESCLSPSFSLHGVQAGTQSLGGLAAKPNNFLHSDFRVSQDVARLKA